jgi:phosphocarrier protein HPr
MPRQTITVTNKLGLHLRASSKLSQMASSFPCEVWLERNTKRINAKSVLGVTMLAAGLGAEVTIETSGEQEDLAMQSLVKLFEDKFGEEA